MGHTLESFTDGSLPDGAAGQPSGSGVEGNLPDSAKVEVAEATESMVKEGLLAEAVAAGLGSEVLPDGMALPTDKQVEETMKSHGHTIESNLAANAQKSAAELS